MFEKSSIKVTVNAGDNKNRVSEQNFTLILDLLAAYIFSKLPHFIFSPLAALCI